MSSKAAYKIRKIEYDFGLSKIRPKFPKMPELYLELLVNKKKVNITLSSEKYIHHYEPIISSEDSPTSLKPIPRITSVSKKDQSVDNHDHNLPQNRLSKGTFIWQSSDSMEPSPIVVKRTTKPVSSSPPQEGSISSTRYRKVKKSIISSYEKKENYEPQRQNYQQHDKEELKPPYNQQQPSTKEIKQKFGTQQPNITNLEDYDNLKDEDDQKRELLFKFHRLKKTYPKVNLPEFNMMSNHENMKRTYETTVKNLTIDSTVETYKSYMMMGFMGCEVVLGKIGFDMEGYTQQQTLYMNSYEKLLIELGEKSYVPSSINKWPVEIKLASLFLFQTTIFIGSKIIAKKTNVNILQMYNSANGVYEAKISRPQSMGNGVSSSGFASGGSSPLTFIPKTKRIPSTTSEGGRMKGPSVTRD